MKLEDTITHVTVDPNGEVRFRGQFKAGDLNKDVLADCGIGRMD